MRLRIIVGQTKNLSLNDLTQFPERGRIFLQLIEKCNANGIDVDFGDVDYQKKADFELHFDFQFRKPTAAKNYLIQFETKNVNPKNIFINSWLSNKYNKIYSWDQISSKSPNQRFVHSMIPYSVPRDLLPVGDNYRIYKYLMISSNRNLVLPVESMNNGYAARQNVIRWFEEQQRDDLIVFGRGWDQQFQTVGSRWIRGDNLQKKQNFSHVNYGGIAASKFEVLAKSVFSICYENVLGNEFYYTEKIFDSLFCGSIPIYRPNKTVESLIPSDCFINSLQFKSISEMIGFCDNLSSSRVAEIRFNISQHVRNFDWYSISDDRFVDELLLTLLADS